MKRSNSMLSLVILLLLKSASYSYAQTTPDSLIQKMDTLFKNLQGTNRPGCAVAIISNGSVVFKKGYGLANLEHSIPLTTSSIFDIASVSKQFTGLAVSMLIQQGRISPDDDIRQYLPEIPQFAKTITIRHLLHHTSGIRDWPEALGLAGWREGELFAFKDIMRMVKYQRDLNFEPGSEFLYSNTGYNLLAAIVEKVTGKSFRTWTGENIFQPLGMNASHFSDDHSEVIKNLAASYILMGNGFHLVPDELTAYGSSSLYTSIDDLCKWVINFQKSISDHDPVYIRMLDQGKLNNGDTVHYGYGLGTGNDRGLKVISHNGSWAGYRTEITNYPDPKLSIILLSNTARFNPDAYSENTANIFLKDKFKAISSAGSSLKEGPTVNVDTLLLKRYTGMFELGPGWIVTLTLDNGKLMTQATGEPKFPMEARSDSSFWINAYGASMIFVTDNAGNVGTLKYKNILAKRILHPWNPDSLDLKEYAGTYYSKELFTKYKLDFSSGKLTMHHMRIGDFEIQPDPGGKDRFSPFLFGQITFLRDSKQKIMGFKYAGGRVRNLVFDKQN